LTARVCLYQESSAIEENVKGLQDRICHLMVVIVENVTARNEESEEASVKATVKAAKGIESDIKDLLRYSSYNLYFETIGDYWVHHSTLTMINKELTEVREQNRWLTVFYKDLNMSPVESCLNRLSTSLEKFKVCLCKYHVYGTGG